MEPLLWCHSKIIVKSIFFVVQPLEQLSQWVKSRINVYIEIIWKNFGHFSHKHILLQAFTLSPFPSGCLLSCHAAKTKGRHNAARLSHLWLKAKPTAVADKHARQMHWSLLICGCKYGCAKDTMPAVATVTPRHNFTTASLRTTSMRVTSATAESFRRISIQILRASAYLDKQQNECINPIPAKRIQKTLWKQGDSWKKKQEPSDKNWSKSSNSRNQKMT